MLFVFCGKTENSFPHLIMYTTKRNIPTALMLASATVLVVVLMLAAGAPVAEAGSIPPPHCNPDVSDALPPRLRRICAALYGIAEISNAVEQYLDEKSKSKIRPDSYLLFHRSTCGDCPVNSEWWIKLWTTVIESLLFLPPAIMRGDSSTLSWIREKEH